MNKSSQLVPLMIGFNQVFKNSSVDDFTINTTGQSEFPLLLKIEPLNPLTRRIFPTQEMLDDENLNHYCIQLSFAGSQGCLTVSIQGLEVPHEILS